MCTSAIKLFHLTIKTCTLENENRTVRPTEYVCEYAKHRAQNISCEALREEYILGEKMLKVTFSAAHTVAQDAPLPG